MKIFRVLFIGMLSVQLQWAIAGEPSHTNAYPDSITLKIRQLLVKKKFRELNSVLDRYQKDAESNVADEEKLLIAYKAFGANEASYEDLLNGWIKSAPGHYQPYLARARYYYDMAWVARGSKWASETSENQMSRMNDYLDKVVKDIEKVISLNSKTIISYFTLTGIANIRGMDGCYYNLLLLNDEKEKEALYQELLSNVNNLGCLTIAAHSKDNPDSYIIMGVSDERVVKRISIDNHNSKLYTALKNNNATISNSNKMIELIAAKLGITAKYDEELQAVNAGLKISPASYILRKNYLYANTPRWGGSYEKMQRYAEESRKYLSDNPKLRLLEGMAYADAGRSQVLVKKYSVAEDIFTQGLQFGESYDLFYQRGKTRYRREQYAEALKDFNKAIELFPEDGDYYDWRSRTYSRLGDYDNALPDAMRADLLKPNDKDIKQHKDWVVSKITTQGYELNKAKKPADAIRKFDTAINVSPKDPDLYYRRSRAYSKQYNYQSALKDIKKAIELDPKNINYYVMVDWLLAKRQDWDQIIRYWDQYIALDPNTSQAYLERGGAYYHKGDLKSAVSDAKIAADMGDPDAKQVYDKYKGRVR